MKKSSKRFVLSSERENDNGFRVRTGGIDLSDFRKNPLLLWMHQRPQGKSKNEILPLGYWEDIEVTNGQVTAVPVFDDSDDFALKIYHKVENGTIKMASSGLGLPHVFAQYGDDLWLEKSRMLEGSLCDLGSNSDALATVALYNDQEELITLSLSDIQSQIQIHMKMIQLNASEVLTKLNLPDTATPDQATEAINNLVTLATNQKSTIATLTTDKTAAETRATELQTKLDDQVKLSRTKEVETLLSKAQEDRKITADEIPHYTKLASTDEGFKTIKELMEKRPAAPAVKTALAQNGAAATDYSKLTWDEMDKKDILTLCKKEDLETFKLKYKEKFKTDFAE